MSIFSKIFGGGEKEAAKLWPVVEKINGLEKDFESLADEALKNKTKEFRARLAKGESLDDLLSEAFAAVRESAKRSLGQRHFDVQLIGGITLHQGRIAEMKTGEGKTLSSTLAVYLNALEGKGVHVITVNDYLSRRDTNWMGPIYHLLGLTVGCIVHDKAYLFEPAGAADKNEVTVEMQNLKEVPRRQAYEADITYGTNNEYGFDYLRDNMVGDVKEIVQRSHNYAIVDEVDSILIDEARTPLIISAPDVDSGKLYEMFAGIVPRLKPEEDYTVDEKMRTVSITEAGVAKVEKILGMDIYNEGGIRYVHHLEQALRAEVLFHLDKDYVVKDGEVIIVDDFTGRLMFGRRYSEGLHQAIEAKEKVKVQQESRTLATITFQNYFRMYKKLAGMTGTAATNAEEFSKVYNLEVVVIPSNKPMVRQDTPDRIYRTENGKFLAVVREIKEKHEQGEPVLVGTVSIEKNERLSALLKREGIAHQVLNAKNHEQEAQIIAQAGAAGAVTVATNMAGRGVDIILGGRPENPAEHEKVVGSGGLHIIGTERHEARRIDNQLRGRAGRQGDPGSSQFFVSLEDDLMRIFGPGAERMKRVMSAMNVPEDQPIESGFASRAIESAQGKIEGYNFDLRKHVLEYDDVMNKQRQRIYRMRREILENIVETAVNQKKDETDNSSEDLAGDGVSSGSLPEGMKKDEETTKINLRQKISDSVQKELRGLVEANTLGDPSEWNHKEIFEVANAIFPLLPDALQKINDFKDSEEIINYLIDGADSAYEAKEKEVGEQNMRQIERLVMLRTIDIFWMDHLDNMDHLRDSVRLRAYGQRDPLVEYKNEGHRLFQSLLAAIDSSVAKTIFRVTLNKEPAREASPIVRHAQENRPAEGAQTAKSQPGNKNIGRNDPCWCGSGKKFKKCHGK
jgi:preprotein translocase subunit SecA